jgi:phospholipase/lecithinase/hemolysin
VETLIASGARNFLVVNSPDLSKLPTFVGTSEAPVIAGVSDEYNTLLALEIAEIASANPQVNIDFYSLDKAIDYFVTNSTSFGFDNVTQAGFNETTVCPDPNRYFFWDAVHPTTRAHGLIAQGFYNSVPGPLPVFGVLSAFGWSRRLRQRLQTGLS